MPDPDGPVTHTVIGESGAPTPSLSTAIFAPGLGSLTAFIGPLGTADRLGPVLVGAIGRRTLPLTSAIDVNDLGLAPVEPTGAYERALAVGLPHFAQLRGVC